MRTRNLMIFMVLAALSCIIFASDDATAAKRTVALDGQVHALNFSKSVPDELNYQGYLAAASDSSAVTATLEMTFRLFDSETKGAELWSETHPAVPVINGLFQVLLGSVTALPNGLFDGAEMWLQTEVETEVLSPRKPLVSVAYSHRTNSAEMLEDNTLTDLDSRWVNEEDLNHLDAADGDPADAVSVDDAGRVGIGTASPLTELDVNGDVNAASYYGDGSNLTGISGTADADWTINGNDVYHQTGNVGIGTTTPAYPLDVSGSVNATTYYGDGSNLTGIAGSADADWTISGDTVYHEVGPVGIGTTNPTAPLTIQAIAGDEILFPSSGNNIDIKAQGEFRIGTLSTSPLHLLTENNFRLTVLAGDGHVGIGTTLPYERLHLHDDAKGSCYTQFTTTSTGNGSTDGLIVGINPDGNAFIYNRESMANLNLGTDNNTRLYIDNTGEVGIGTTSPAYKLDVNGDVNATSYYGDGSNLTGIAGAPDADWTISGSDMYSAVSGNVGIGTTSPQEKLHVHGNASYVVSKVKNDYANGNSWFISENDAQQWYVGVAGTDADKFQIALPADPKITIATDGKVGIGTTDPEHELEVAGISDPTIQVTDSGNSVKTAIQSWSGGGWIGTLTNHPLRVATNGAYRMVLDASGNVGIGTASPGAKLHVSVDSGSPFRLNTNEAAGVGMIAFYRSGTMKVSHILEDDDTYAIWVNGDRRLAIQTDGNVGIGTTSPARTLHVNDVMRLEPTSAPSSPSEGDMYMDSSTHKLMVYDGTTWQACW